MVWREGMHRSCVAVPLLATLAITAAFASSGAPAAAATTAMPCQQADEAFDAGRLGEARTAYAEVPGTEKCATAGMAAVRTVQRLCDQGDAELEMGRKDDALASYDAALEKNPNAACARTGAQQADQSWLSRTADDLAEAIPKVATGLGVLLLVGYGLLLPAYIRPVHRLFARLPLLGRVLSPRLTLESLDDKALPEAIMIGAPMAARVRERLQRYRDDARRPESFDLDLDVGSNEESYAEIVASNRGLSNTLAKAGELSEHTKLVAGMLQVLYAILPIRQLTVSGVLDPPSPKGVGATLSLESGSRLESAIHVDGPPLGRRKAGAADYLRLADPIAVWIQCEVATILQGGRRRAAPDRGQSHALVHEGAARQHEGDHKGARALYERSVEIHRSNWAARVNLAVTEARLAGNYRRSCQELRKGLAARRKAGDA